jgi:hypothetical protein
MAQVPADLRPPERIVMWTILQLHYGDAKVHFELQPQPARSLVEVGLHFEGDPDRNEALAQKIAARPDLPALHGDDWELEEWTASWRRLHIAFPAPVLTRSLASEAAAAFSRLICETGELVRELSVRSRLAV